MNERVVARPGSSIDRIGGVHGQLVRRADLEGRARERRVGPACGGDASASAALGELPPLARARSGSRNCIGAALRRIDARRSRCSSARSCSTAARTPAMQRVRDRWCRRSAARARAAPCGIPALAQYAIASPSFTCHGSMCCGHGHRDRRRGSSRTRRLPGVSRRSAPAPLPWSPSSSRDALDASTSASAERLKRDQPVERALQLAHVRELDAARASSIDAGRELDIALLALAAEDRDARLVVRRADVHDQAAGEARQQPLVDVGDLGGRPVARHARSASAPLQHVEEPQQLALRLAGGR